MNNNALYYFSSFLIKQKIRKFMDKHNNHIKALNNRIWIKELASTGRITITETLKNDLDI